MQSFLFADSNRPIQYVVLPPLESNTLRVEYQKAAVALVKRVKERLKRKGRLLTLFEEQILMSAHLLASGHPRTVEFLIEAINGESVLGKIVSAICEKAKNANSFELLTVLATLKPL